MEPNIYYSSGTNSSVGGWTFNLDGAVQLNSIDGNYSVKKLDDGKIHAELAFKYIKKKLGILEKVYVDRRLKKLEQAFYNAVENGQEGLGEKFMRELMVEARQSLIAGRGFKHYVENDDIRKYKNKIKGGHISDTQFKDYTRIIPKDVLEKKKKSEGLFDGYVIYHYWDAETEKKVAKKEKMTPDEKQKMKDPILFGWIKENNRLYFIADWEDEYCDLTFDEIVDVVGENKIEKNPILNNN